MYDLFNDVHLILLALLTKLSEEPAKPYPVPLVKQSDRAHQRRLIGLAKHPEARPLPLVKFNATLPKFKAKATATSQGQTASVDDPVSPLALLPSRLLRLEQLD